MLKKKKVHSLFNYTVCVCVKVSLHKFRSSGNKPRKPKRNRIFFVPLTAPVTIPLLDMSKSLNQMSDIPLKPLKYAEVMGGWWNFRWQHVYHRLHPRGAGTDFMYEAASCANTFFSSSCVSFRLCAALLFCIRNVSTPLSDSLSRWSPPSEPDSKAERLHPARQLRVVGFVPRWRRRLG